MSVMTDRSYNAQIWERSSVNTIPIRRHVSPSPSLAVYIQRAVPMLLSGSTTSMISA
jgi:hypothetical protein